MKNVFTSLGNLFPRYLTLLALAPIIVGLLLNPEMVDLRYVVINLAWLAVFTGLAHLLKSKVVFVLAALFFFILSMIEVSNWAILQGPINIVSLLAFTNTNGNEAMEFMKVDQWWNLLMLVPVILLFVASLWRKRKAPPLRVFSIVVWIVALAFLGENAFNGRFLRKGSPHAVKTIAAFYKSVSSYRQAIADNKLREGDAINSLPKKPQTLVLIIGESLGRKYMSLYGAERETNPRLAKRKDLVVFEDAISPCSNTISSVVRCLSEVNIENYDTTAPEMDLLDIAHQADFKTFWLSNQAPMGVWENIISSMAHKADVTSFVNAGGNTSFESTYVRSLDEKLLDPLAQALADSTPHKLIILHLMGNHTSYSRRYSEPFARWKGEGELESTQAHYCNAVLYNDFVVDRMLQLVQDASRQKEGLYSAIYLSDHGENVYDEFGLCGHYYNAILPKSNLDIPLVAWFSDSYKTERKEKYAHIQSAGKLPYMTDDLFHTIQDVLHIRSSYYDSSRSLFHPSFDASRVRRMENGEDYDKLVY